MKKLLILVLSSNTYPSKRNEKVLKKTWVLNNSKNVQTIFYKAGKKTSFIKNNLFVESGKQTKDIGAKTIKAFDWALENIEFDYIFRTNSSSYINVKNLLNYLESFDEQNNFLYNGIVMSLPKNNSREAVDFISGAGILLNKQTIKLIIENKDQFNNNEWDDVAIGMLLKKNGVKPTVGKRFDISGNIFYQDIEKNFYHYRCRIDNHYGYPRFLEKFVILHLHNEFKNRKVSDVKILFYRNFFEISKIFYIQSPFWKIYNFILNFSRKLIPKFIYKFIKKTFKKLDSAIKLRYLKK